MQERPLLEDRLHSLPAINLHIMREVFHGEMLCHNAVAAQSLVARPQAYDDLATRLPLAFFFGVSTIESPVHDVSEHERLTSISCVSPHTWWQRLPELLGLVRVLEHEGVEVALASDLELGLADVLLYPRRCKTC